MLFRHPVANIAVGLAGLGALILIIDESLPFFGGQWSEPFSVDGTGGTSDAAIEAIKMRDTLRHSLVTIEFLLAVSSSTRGSTSHNGYELLAFVPSTRHSWVGGTSHSAQTGRHSGHLRLPRNGIRQ